MGSGTFGCSFWTITVLLIVRAWILFLAPSGLSGDAFGYVDKAVHIVNTGKLPPLNLQPNGFPILLAPIYAIAGDNIATMVLWVHCAMDILIVLTLVFLISKSMDNRPPSRIKLALFLLVIVQPFTATMVSSVYADASCGFLIFTATLLLGHATQRRKWGPHLAFLAGLMLGIAATERTDLLPVGLVLLVGYSLVTFAQDTPQRRNYAAAIAVVFSLIMPASMVAAFQYSSTEEVGLIKVVKRYEDPGYFAWLRASFLTEAEFRPIGWSRGSPGWEGFAISSYPSRMFDSPEEKEAIRGLLSEWRNGGMTPRINAGFSDFAQRKVEARPIRHYVVLPTLRMVNYWINVDGAQTLLRVVPLQRPWSQIFVGLVIGMRLIVVALCAVGIFALVRANHRNLAPTPIMRLAFFAVIAMAARTLELGALSPFLEAGLSEYRYMGILFPTALLLAIFGAVALTTSQGQTSFYGQATNSATKVRG